MHASHATIDPCALCIHKTIIVNNFAKHQAIVKFNSQFNFPMHARHASIDACTPCIHRCMCAVHPSMHAHHAPHRWYECVPVAKTNRRTDGRTDGRIECCDVCCGCRPKVLPRESFARCRIYTNSIAARDAAARRQRQAGRIRRAQVGYHRAP